MSSQSKVNQSRIREALTAGTNEKGKGPPVADGILSVTPDTPEMMEWRSRSALDVAETSSTFLDDEDDGPKPHELYGKFTWKIENFSEVNKRELRSNVFDVGNYKWYILVYPQGCDVCNHLSLFLCVADYDKLLPGWSHFAQFTIAVVNKDPKKSKYSDTLHRFCKKEHDWGWKKFMELSKVLDGFTVADTLVIKAQVQVILDKPSKPFRCLDPQYRRELVRVYLTNVENICRRFCEDKKARLAWTRDDVAAFRHFWASLPPEQQRKNLMDRGEVILKAVVKQFFNEKEVTSTLVMDALYSGCKQIEEHSRNWLEGKCGSDNAPCVLIKAERSTFTLCGDLMDIAERVQKDFIPAAKDDSKALQPNDGLTLRSGQEGDDYRRDSIERDEKRLAELGRKTIEMFVIAHIFCEKLEIAYRDAEALKRQDQLIAEEFEMARLEESKAMAKAAADKEKKAKKKEKMKQKKEAEKQRRDAEEAERKAREAELRKQEEERRAKEAEKKRLEDAAAQQVLPPKKAKGKERAQPQQPQQQVVAKAKLPAPQQQAPASSSSSRAAAATSSAAAGSAAQRSGSATAPSDAQVASAWPPSLSSLAAAAVSAADADALASSAGQAERPAGEPPSESGSEGEVGTVNQATGVQESSGDGEDDDSTEAPGAGTESDGVSESDTGRAALEEEVGILRAQVGQLQRLLAERDAELFALRAQLLELQPTEIADMVAAVGPGGQGAGAAAGARAGSSGSLPHLPAENGAMGRDASDAGQHAAAGPRAAVDAAERGAAGQGHAAAKPEPSAANGPARTDSGSAPSAIPAAAAAVAAAAVRRMQPHAGPGSGAAAAHGHDASSTGHYGGVAAQQQQQQRPGGNAPGGLAAAGARGMQSGHMMGGRQGVQGQHGMHAAMDQAAAHHAQQQPASGSAGGAGSHLGGVMMQRSTSATLPSGVSGGAPGAGGAGGPYAQITQQQLAAASASANGRQRQDTSVSSSVGGSKPAPYMPASVAAAAAAAAGSGGATANGIGGGLHASAAGQGPDGLPSYRNAAAGVLPAGQAAPGGAAGGAGAGGPGSMAPVSPGGAQQAQHKRAEESTPTGPGPRRMADAGPAQAPAPSPPPFGNPRMMGLSAAFNTPAQVAASVAATKRAAATQLDSPGLEDFAHINMIDDLLTE